MVRQPPASELGRAAARTVVEAGGQLVFPALVRGDAELVACRSPLRQMDDHPPRNIANRLLAELPAGVDPEAVACAVRSAVMQHWRDIALEVKRECAELLADHIDASWEEQIATFVEFAATWAPLGDYAEARRSVDRALAARKHLRDFVSWRCLRGGVPKSSLDGGRETVLRKPNDGDAARRRDGATGPSKPSDGAARLARKYGIGLLLDERAGYAGLHAEVSAWIERMQVARMFAMAAPRSRHGAGVEA